MIEIPGKIPVRIHPLFFLMAGVIGWLATANLLLAVVWALVILITILFHEFGHAYTALYFGQNAAITLMMMGGLTERKGPPLKLWQEFLIVLNGPNFGLLLFLASSYLLTMVPASNIVLHTALQASIHINLIWTILNLLPVGPLDGGRLLSILCEAIFGSRGIRFSLLIGIVVGMLMGAFGLLYHQPFIAVVFFMLTFDTLRMYQASRQLTDHDRKGEIQIAYQLAERAYARGDILEALEKFQQIRYATQSGILFNASTEHMARILSDQGEFEEAYSVLKPIEKHLSPAALRLFHRLAYYSRELDAVIRVGNKCFETDPSFDTAFLNALANALKGNLQQAIGWLQSAKREGMPDLKENLQKKEFDSIRRHPAFVEFIQSLDRSDNG